MTTSLLLYFETPPGGDGSWLEMDGGTGGEKGKGVWMDI